jgi:hypothetical protein
VRSQRGNSLLGGHMICDALGRAGASVEGAGLTMSQHARWLHSATWQAIASSVRAEASSVRTRRVDVMRRGTGRPCSGAWSGAGRLAWP